MCLTIHYNLETKLTRPDEVRRLVEGLRQYAMDLPFQEIGDVVEFKGEDVGYQNRDDPNRWLKIQAGQYLNDGPYSYSVAPLHIIAFTTVPGAGSEPANFGLCSYPQTIVPPNRRRIRTKLKGWLWRSFCKTQYASDPACGGVTNFLRCHATIVKLLDFAKKTDLIDVEVTPTWRRKTPNDRQVHPKLGCTAGYLFMESGKKENLHGSPAKTQLGILLWKRAVGRSCGLAHGIVAGAVFRVGGSGGHQLQQRRNSTYQAALTRSHLKERRT